MPNPRRQRSFWARIKPLNSFIKSASRRYVQFWCPPWSRQVFSFRFNSKRTQLGSQSLYHSHDKNGIWQFSLLSNSHCIWLLPPDCQITRFLLRFLIKLLSFIMAFKNTGDTYFRSCSTIIGSESLTSVFGMETGGTFRISSPEISSQSSQIKKIFINNARVSYSLKLMN